MARRPQSERLDEDAAQRMRLGVSSRRKNREWSYQELAQRAGLSIGTVRAIESGRIQEPGVFTLQRIARAYGHTIEQLLEGKESKRQAGAAMRGGRAPSGVRVRTSSSSDPTRA